MFVGRTIYNVQVKTRNFGIYVPRYSSGVTSHRQPRQCRGPKMVNGAQSDPNYVSRLGLGPVANVCRRQKIIVTPQPSSAETLVRGGGKINHHLIDFCLSYNSAKNCRNRWMNVRVVACQVSVVFTARCYASAVLAMALCPSVRLSQVGVLLKRLNVGSHKQHHTIAQGL